MLHVSGVLLLALIVGARAPRSVSETLFWTQHPLHVLLSALVTAAMFHRHGGRSLWNSLGLGYLGSVGIATLSDCLLPFAGEWLLSLPHRGLHLGFIEKWWLVNPLAVGGIALGCLWPHTKAPHAGHVLRSTWSSNSIRSAHTIRRLPSASPSGRRWSTMCHSLRLSFSHEPVTQFAPCRPASTLNLSTEMTEERAWRIEAPWQPARSGAPAVAPLTK